MICFQSVSNNDTHTIIWSKYYCTEVIVVCACLDKCSAEFKVLECFNTQYIRVYNQEMGYHN